MADKDKAPTQADYDKAWENAKKDPKSAPKFIDGMPPKETPDPKKGAMKGAEIGGLNKYMPSKEVSKFDDNYKHGGKVSSASKRADGCAVRGKTKGKIC
jgi:hypothetical protein